MTTYSPVKHKENMYSIPTTSSPNNHAQCISATSMSMLNLHTNTKLPLAGKEYVCFQNDGKTAQAAKCIRSRIMNKVIEYVLSIDTFEQQCVVLKGILQSPCLKDHVKTIVIDQSLRNSALFGHRCLQIIKKLCKHAGKCDYQQQFKNIIEVAMFSTHEGFTNKIPISPMTPTPVKKPSDKKTTTSSH